MSWKNPKIQKIPHMGVTLFPYSALFPGLGLVAGSAPHTPGPGTQVPAEWDGRLVEWDGRNGTAGNRPAGPGTARLDREPAAGRPPGWTGNRQSAWLLVT